MAFAFEKLAVYQKSVDFADEICRQIEQFPRGYGFLADWPNSHRQARRFIVSDKTHGSVAWLVG